MTADEIQADLEATIRDIDCLEKIVGALAIFIHMSHGENRSAYRLDLWKYESILKHARELKPVIERALKPANEEEFAKQSQKTLDKIGGDGCA